MGAMPTSQTDDFESASNVFLSLHAALQRSLVNIEFVLMSTLPIIKRQLQKLEGREARQICKQVGLAKIQLQSTQQSLCKIKKILCTLQINSLNQEELLSYKTDYCYEISHARMSLTQLASSLALLSISLEDQSLIPKPGMLSL